MATTKDGLLRIKIIDELLSNTSSGYTTNELLNEVNNKLKSKEKDSITLRTVQRDLNDLETIYEASLERNHNGMIKYKNSEFSIFKQVFSKDEKDLLRELLKTICQFDGLEEFEQLKNMQDTITENQNQDDNGESKQLKNIQDTIDYDASDTKKIIYFFRNPYLKNIGLLGKLYTCISRKATITFEYKSFNNESETKIVYPYLLKEFNNRWYLIAENVDKNSNSREVIPLDRIVINKTNKDSTIVERPDIEYKEPIIDWENIFEEIIGVTYDENVEIENVIIWATEKRAPYIETKPIHGSQKEIKDESYIIELQERYPILKDKGGRFFKFECRPNKELISLLFSFSDDLVVLEPQNLRSKMTKIAKNITKYYETNKKNAKNKKL